MDFSRVEDFIGTNITLYQAERSKIVAFNQDSVLKYARPHIRKLSQQKSTVCDAIAHREMGYRHMEVIRDHDESAIQKDYV